MQGIYPDNHQDLLENILNNCIKHINLIILCQVFFTVLIMELIFIYIIKNTFLLICLIKYFFKSDTLLILSYISSISHKNKNSI